jgi:hypothetical protein
MIHGCFRWPIQAGVIKFDLFSQKQSAYSMSDIDMPTEGAQLQTMRTLLDHGHGQQVLISHDIRTRSPSRLIIACALCAPPAAV